MIPRGKVATYGQVAALAGMPSHSRYVGRTLSELPAGTRLPWHRVVNASFRSSLPPTSAGYQRQMARLRAEQVSFIGTRVARHHRWEP